MAEACNDFYRRFKRAFGDVPSGTEIIGDAAIYTKVLAFFGCIPFTVTNDYLWWARGMKAMPIEKLRFEPGGLYYLGGLECKIARVIPFDCPNEPEKSFVYFECEAMPATGNYSSAHASAYTSWNTEPVCYYKGRRLSDEEANGCFVIDGDGNRIGISPRDMIRFDRFLSPQNLLLTAKACPVVCRESGEVWDKMDEILAGTGTVEELRNMIQETNCYLRD